MKENKREKRHWKETKKNDKKEKENSNYCGCVELFLQSISFSHSLSNISRNKFRNQQRTPFVGITDAWSSRKWLYDFSQHQ